jgi:hypothetical protein
MKKVDLFFCGDSFTWGEELQGTEQNHRRRERERFSGVLAKRLDKTHVNISRSGTSNDWIVKKTIEWFEQGNSCDTAIIQFSHEKRWIWYDEVGKSHHMPAKSHNTQAPCKHTALNNYWKNMFLIRNYLKDKCKIVHLSLTTAPYGTIGKDYKKNFWYKCVGDVSILELKPLLRSEKENWCPNLNSDILDDNNNKRFSGAHPSAKGHILIAETICP